MKTIHVRIDDAPDLRFVGELIARVSDHHHEGPRKSSTRKPASTTTGTSPDLP